MKESFAGAHADFKNFGLRGVQLLTANGAAIELFEQIGQVTGDEINDVEIECFLGSGRFALDHSGPGPLDIAMATIGDGFDESGSVVLHFFLHHLIGFLDLAHADGNRMRGADAGVRRHSGDVRREGDERARAARARA